jgi:arsenate reductase (glutaredoxin)
MEPARAPLNRFWTEAEAQALRTMWSEGAEIRLPSAPRTALRTTKSPAAELGLLDQNVGPEAIMDAMVAQPILVNRPIVCTAKGVRLCRPSETVLDLLDRMPPGPLYKENGELIIDETGRRVG